MKRLILIFSLLAITLLQSWAQKPKLGLVLSGGGAKGIAHIGVLKAMEKAGLRPDFITGTSMGSIIGGLYAIGYSADQIEEIIREIDWDQVLSNNIPLNYISYEEKEYYNRFLLELAIQHGRIQLPSGLIEGQMLSEALSHYTWPSMKYKSFDEFPIPYRCVATDVSNGQAIVFKEGSLAEAMRASMAIPTAFTAADLDTTLAVDGGVVNNFPADVLKDLGADIIIGVNVTRGFKKAEDINSMPGILMQMSMLSSNERLPEQKKLCNVYIEPNLDDYNNASFSKYEEILEIGNAAGKQFQQAFDSLSGLVEKHEIPSGLAEEEIYMRVDQLELSGNKLFNDDLIKSKLGFTEGDTVAADEVEEGVRTVYGINGFKKVDYAASHKEDGGMNFKLKMNEKPAASIRAAFHYDNIFSAGILVNFQVRDLLLKSSRTILAVDISENPRFRFDYYKYTGRKQRVALNFRYDFGKEQLPVYEKGSKLDVQINTEHFVSLNLLTTKSLKNSYRIGVSHELNRYRSAYGSIFPAGISYGEINSTELYFSYTRNTLNNRNYPTDGTELLVSFHAMPNVDYSVKYHTGQDSINMGGVYISEKAINDLLEFFSPGLYGQFYLRIYDYLELSKKFQIIPSLGLALNLSKDSAYYFYRERYVGGYQQVKINDTRFVGLNYAEFELLNYAIGGLFFQNVLFNNFYLTYGANALAYYEHIPISNVKVDFNRLMNDQLMLGYGARLTYKSFIGPISFGASSNTNDGYIRYYFSVGYSFNYSD